MGIRLHGPGVWGEEFFAQGKRLVGGRRVRGSGGLSPPDVGEIFKKFTKIPLKNYNFRPIFHNFNENFVKNVSNF